MVVDEFLYRFCLCIFIVEYFIVEFVSYCQGDWYVVMFLQ